MNLNFFLQGIKNIVFNPVKLWEPVKSGDASANLIRNSLFFPIAVMVAISAFFGSMLFTNAALSPVYSVLLSIKCFLVILLTVFTTSYILGEITYPLDLGKNFNISFSMVVFSATPFLMCQILSRLFESLLFVNIIGFYGFYIFWIGAERLLNPPRYKKMPLLIATVITFAGIYTILNLLLNMVTDRLYFAIFS
jgi:hypothetical protein